MATDEDMREQGRQIARAVVRMGRSMTALQEGIQEVLAEEADEETVQGTDPWAPRTKVLTPMDAVRDAVAEEENLQVELLRLFGPEDLPSYRFYAAGDRAHNAVQLALVEQQRINNLLMYIVTFEGEDEDVDERIKTQVREALGI